MKRILVILFVLICGTMTILFSKDMLKLGFPKPYIKVIAQSADRYMLDENLIYSVIRAESRYDKKAVSYAGAKGLMQLSDDTFVIAMNNIDISGDVFDPKTNIYAGAWYLSYLFSITNDINETVKAYNCGLGNLDKKIAQTQIFERRVFEFLDIYNYLY